jgi:phage FluMu protein Com
MDKIVKVLIYTCPKCKVTNLISHPELIFTTETRVMGKIIKIKFIANNSTFTVSRRRNSVTVSGII